jgi:hypothetical protein
MLIGWFIYTGSGDREQSVLAIGKKIHRRGAAPEGHCLPPERFHAFASFMTVYFIVELVSILLYASNYALHVQAVASRARHAAAGARNDIRETPNQWPD